MRLRIQKNRLFVALILLLLTGCATTRFQPVSGIHNTEDRYTIVRTDSLLIAVRPQSYIGSFESANSRFFPIYVRIRNLTASKQGIDKSSFSILSNGLQYDYIPLEYILGSMQNMTLFEELQNPFERDTALAARREKDQDNYFELLSRYLNFSDILPGVVKEGYLFYDRDLWQSNQIAIDVLGHLVQYKK